MTQDDTTVTLEAIFTQLFELALQLGRYEKQVIGRAMALPQTDDKDLDVTRAGLVGIARRLLEEMDARTAAFADAVPVEPAWPMMLDLYVRGAQRKRVSVSDACIASRAPPTTALRWIADLEKQGYIERARDTVDRRRSFLALSDAAFSQMSGYLAGIAGIETVAAASATAKRSGDKRALGDQME